MNKAKKLRGSMEDYKNFSHILLALSTFLYLGSILAGHEQPELYNIIVICSAFLFIALAFVFRYISQKCYEQLLEIEEEQDYFTR